MSRSTALKRLGIAAVATVTLGAGIPAFFATSASAAPATQLSITPQSPTVAPGECQSFTVTPQDAQDQASTDTPTITIDIVEQPTSDSQTVSLCDVGTGGLVEDQDTGATGSDTATVVFGADRASGPVTFGVRSNIEGGAIITASGESDTGAIQGTSTTVSFAEPTASATPTPTMSMTPSASPSDTATSTASPSPSQTTGTGTPAPTQTTGTGTPTPTQTAGTPTPTPTQTGQPNCGTGRPTVTLDRSTIIATGSAQVTVSGLPANSIVELYAYTRPSTTFRKVREAEVAGTSTTFRIVPPANTRLYAVVRGCPAANQSPSIVLNVRTALSLSVVRTGKQTYRFSGDSLPARSGGLVVSLYRVTADGRQVLTSQARANATNGEYVINRRFTGTGRFGFVVRTGQDIQNAPGSSNVRSLLVF